MTPHELVLLSPYRFPGQHSLMLANEDMAAWLNAFTALWHPALLWNAKGPPRCDGQYDHEQPQPNFIYAVPESPPLYLPDDWDERVRKAGSVAFKASVDREATLNNLRAALEAAGPESAGWKQGLDAAPEKLSAFFGLGLGHLLEATLAEAMEHENLLDAAAFWDDVQHAVALLAGFPFTPAAPAPAYNPETGSYPPYDDLPGAPEAQDGSDPSPHLEQPLEGDPGLEQGPGDALAEREVASDTPREGNVASEATDGRETREEPGEDDWRVPLRSAAQKLVSAREVLYPVSIHLLDVCVLDDSMLEQPWPASLTLGTPLNVVASGRLLEQLARQQPPKFEELRVRVQAEEAEVCGGGYLEREEPLLPIDSQLWNLHKGLAVARDLLGAEVRVFARKRFGFHPQLPLLLTTSGLTRALFLCFDEASGVPQYSGCVVAWPSPDGKQVDAFVRKPYPADSAQTFFNLGHYWFKTTREDHAATLALSHTGQAPAPWYQDLMELNRLAPVLGTWTTFSRYFNDVMAGEHPPALSADEFHSDFLSERTHAHLANPVSGFAAHLRLRRRIDGCWTLAALHRSLSGAGDTLKVAAALEELEDRLESAPGVLPTGLEEMEKFIARTLAERLQVRSPADQPGYLFLNPCAFARRVALELEGGARPLALVGQVKASQLDGNLLRAVVEVPALGFAWIPREGPPGTGKMAARVRLVDAASHTIRNEFFEAEVDPQTGGLKAIRDHKTLVNRLGQRLVFNPGSRMVAREIKVTSPGPAMGEIVSEGVLLGEQEQELAAFKQRLRVWLGRPLLEMRIEIQPRQPAAGYPWHAYFGARFAWRDERAMLLRGVNGAGYITAHTRPQTPDYLELRMARQSTVIFPGGLPFHQRLEGRMLDIILQPEGEEANVFELAIALDREMPVQTALGWASPLAVVPTTKGPPHTGDSGWLFHLDAPNLMMSRMVPGTLEVRSGQTEAPPPATPYQGGETPAAPAIQGGETPAAAPPYQGGDGGVATRDAVTARFLEIAGHSGHAEFRCVRNPKRAALLDARGGFLVEASAAGDAVLLEVSPNDMVHLQVEFS